MKIAFLGTGSAFSLERYNGAVVVDGRLLLDGGAPLLPHMHRLGIDPGAIEALFLTHFHGDHVLGLPTFMLYRAFVPGGPLAVVGPHVEERLERLNQVAWGDEWPSYRERIDLTYHEAGPAGEVAGVRYESVKLVHGHQDCRGYRIHLDDGRILAYAGDTTASPPLDDLVRGAAVAITEATGPDNSGVHTTWEEAQALAARHPKTRFLFNHLYSGAVPGAADDLAVLDV